MEVSLANGVRWETVNAGDSFLGVKNSWSIAILNPPMDSNHWSTNNSSITMRLAVVRTNGDTALYLTTGDIELIAENWKVENPLNLKADLLKIPHHGSATSSSQLSLNAIQPAVAVISRDSRYENRNRRSLKYVIDRLGSAGIEYHIT